MTFKPLRPYDYKGGNTFIFTQRTKEAPIARITMSVQKKNMYGHEDIKSMNLERIADRKAPAQNFMFPRSHFFSWNFVTEND